MDFVRLDIDVPEGWACWIDLVCTPRGTFAGIAELSLDGFPRCALVITQQLTLEAAVQRATVRADHFVRQWMPRRGQPAARAVGQWPDSAGNTVPGQT